jgi:hypothetical protein
MTAALDPLDLGEGGNEPNRYESTRNYQRSTHRTQDSRFPSLTCHQQRLRQFWTKIRAAWPHRGGKGLSLILSVVPMNVQIVLREPKPPADASKHV